MEKDTHQVPAAASPQSSQLKYEDRKIFVGGISSDTSEETLRSYFTQWGEVEDTKIMYDSDTGRSRGFGFVTYKEPACVHIACQGSHVLDGKKIDPKLAFEKGSESEVQHQVHRLKVFIGGVGQGTTAEMLTAHFSQYGKVMHVDLKVDKNRDSTRGSEHQTPQGKMRGFGFVTFETCEMAAEAAKTKFQEINGKMVEVKPAEPRDFKKYKQLLQVAQQQGSMYPPGNPGYNDYRTPQADYHTHQYNTPYNSQYQYYGYSGTSAAHYSQGSYGGYHQGAPQDYSYARGSSYGGGQDYGYPPNPRSFGSGQQQMTGYPPPPHPPPHHPPPPPQEGTPAGFSQQRTSYTSTADNFTGHPTNYGGYNTAAGYDQYGYSDQPVPAAPTATYGRGTGRGPTGTFGYGR